MNNWQTMTPVANVFVLPRCQMALFEDAGEGQLGNLLWTAQQIDNAHFAESFDLVEHTPTGVPLPQTHQLAGHHEITIEGIWNLNGKMRRGQSYILAVTWNDATLGASPARWYRRYYQNVVMATRQIASREANEFGSNNVLRATHFIESEGAGTPSDPTTGTETC